MNPQPTKVTPAELSTLSGRLADAANALEESLGLFDDPAMWSSADAYKEYFGPAVQVGETYAAMAKKLPDYVRSATDRLTQGAEVFRTAASEFAARDAAHGNGMAPR